MKYIEDTIDRKTFWQKLRQIEHNHDWWATFKAYFTYTEVIGKHFVACYSGVNSKNFAQVAGELTNPRIIDGHYYVDFENYNEQLELEVCSAKFVHELLRGYCWDITLKDKNGDKFTHFYQAGSRWFKRFTPEELEKEEQRLKNFDPCKIVVPKFKNKVNFNFREVVCTAPLKF